MRLATEYFNAHASAHRVGLPTLSGYMEPPAITTRDENLYAATARRNAENRRKAPKVTLSTPDFLKG